MPEVLRDKSPMWHRNNNKKWTSWEAFNTDLLKFFLPPRYLERLENRGRAQRTSETFKDYVLAMQYQVRHSSRTDYVKRTNCLHVI